MVGSLIQTIFVFGAEIVPPDLHIFRTAAQTQEYRLFMHGSLLMEDVEVCQCSCL
jgi:hypothetical protein